MTPGDLVNTVFLAFVAAGLGALFWTRLNRLEEKIDTMAPAADLNGLRAELNTFRTEITSDVGAKHNEVTEAIVSLRSELKET